MAISNEGEVESSIKLARYGTRGKKSMIEFIFLRNSWNPLTVENISLELDVHMSGRSPPKTLQGMLESIWCPTLIDNPEWSRRTPQSVQHHLKELNALLISSIEPMIDGESSADTLDLFDVNSLDDEVRFWEHICAVNRNSSLGTLAEQVTPSLVELNSIGFREIDRIPLTELAGLVGQWLDVLNGIWNVNVGSHTVYSQERMEHLMSMIGSSI